MSLRKAPITIAAILSATVLLVLLQEVRAGEHVRAGKPLGTHSHPANVVVAHATRLAESVAVVVTTPAQPKPTPLYVDIRDPNGQVRRFPVEGGRASIQYRQVILHVGEMLTIHWVAPK